MIQILKNKVFFIATMYSLLLVSCQQGDVSDQNQNDIKPLRSERIISLSGFITEVLYELGAVDQIVGRDVTSTYPKSVTKVTSLGHSSQLNIEGVLALKPDLIFIEEEQLKSSNGIAQLSQAGVNVITVPTDYSLHNSTKAAKVISQHLTIKEGTIDKMAETIKLDSLNLEKTLSKYTTTPKVLFIYARGAGRLMIGGKNTSAAAIIEKAGGQNAIQNIEDFKVLTPEALLEASPEVILMFSSGLASLDGKEGLRQIKGIPQTPAFQNDRIVVMDGHYLTAFGPRAGKAALELAEKIHN